jgi:hypothetical protein
LDVLTGISCTSRTFCMAIGIASSGDYAQTWNGTNWNVTTTFQSPPGSGVIRSVSCVSTDCVAVGYGGDPADDNATEFAEFWNGTSWTTDSPSAAPSQNELQDVSCTSPSQCLGVGEIPTDNSVGQLLGASYSNGSWTDASPSSEPPAAGGVDCAKTADICMEVGRRFSASLWNGSTQSWTPTTPIAPSDYLGFVGVSCPSTTLCVTVGADTVSYASGVGLSPVIEAWNGSGWVLMNTKRVGTTAFTPQVEFLSVSCPSSTFCMAVGEKNLLSPQNDPHPSAAYWGTLP